MPDLPSRSESDTRWCARASWTRPESWLALLLVLFTLSSAWRYGGSWPGIDFYQFWLVGRAVREHRVENVYAPAERARMGEEGFQEALRLAGPNAQKNPTQQLQVANYRRQLETFSTPLLYAFFGSIASGDYARDKANWLHALVVLHAVAILLVAAALGFSLPSALLALAVFQLWFEPYAVDLGNTNVNALLLAALASAFFALARNRIALAGALIGLSIAFKPTLALAPLPLALAWACARDWKPVARAALGLAGGLALGIGLGALLGGGFGAWSRWTGELAALVRGSGEYDDNFALARWLSDHVGITPGIWLIPLLLAPCAFVAWKRRGEAPAPRTCAHWLATGALFALLTPGLVWLHYYVLAIPALLLLFGDRDLHRPEATTPGMWRWILAGGCTLLLSAQLPSQWLGLAGSSQRAPLVIAGALLLFASLLVGLARGESPGRRNPC